MRNIILTLLICSLFTSCATSGNYVTFKPPTFRQLAKCEPWQQQMFTDFCEWKYYDSNVNTKLVFNKRVRKNLYKQHIMILGYAPDTTNTNNVYGSWLKK